MKHVISAVLAASIFSGCFITALAADGIENASFDNGITGWTVSGDNTVSASNGRLTIDTASQNGVRVSQTVTGMTDSVYNLTLDVTNTGVDGVCYAYAKAKGQTVSSTSIPVCAEELKITVPNVHITDGECEIGIYSKGGSRVTADNFEFRDAEATRVPFFKGGEISKLTYIEDMGGVFGYSDGTEGDALQILAENGFNLARIRLLDNPGKGRGEPDYYLPEGYMTEEDCLSMARRAKDKGMQIEFTFAYSDYWVDGAKQYPPASWDSELTGSETIPEKAAFYEKKIYEYTKDVMQKLIAQGTTPEYVSIGNEMQCGMMFNHWKDWEGYNNKGLYYNLEYLSAFVKAGAKAVRETSPESKIIIHTDNGGNVAINRGQGKGLFLKLLSDETYGISEYIDIIGVSYYPFYSDSRDKKISADDVAEDFNALIDEYDKDVIVMESGYNWNEKRGDGYEGQLENSGYYQEIYGETKEGQKAFLTELFAKLKSGVNGGRCLGVLYWDPVMLYDKGTGKIGWAIRESDDTTDVNVVSNSNLFDFDGNALLSQEAMRYNTDPSSRLLITGTVTAYSGAPLTNENITITVNGADIITSTDKFGKYIAAVDYPSDERLDISIKKAGYLKKYSIDAPKYDFVVKDIDFSNSMTVQKTAEENGASVFTVSMSEGGTLPEDIVIFTAEYDDKGILSGVKIGKTTLADDDMSAEININSSSENIFIFLDNNLIPLSSLN